MSRYFFDSQGTGAYFNGEFLGGLVRFDVTPASCQPSDVTSIESNVEGSGIASRVWKQFHPGPIEPGTVTLECLGLPFFVTGMTGNVGLLTVGGQWGSVGYQAFLSKVTIGGSVGEVVRSTWEFQFI